MKFALNTFIYIAIVVGLVFGLPRFLSWALETPYPMAAITSGSMWPALNEGDLVFIKGGLKPEDLGVGDIIVWRGADGRGFTIHRVARVHGSEILTQGDANFNEDSPIQFDQVVGRAVEYKSGKPINIPYLGSITVMASNLKDQP